MNYVVYERDRLYEEVWAEPVVKVAERYGVSDVALAKTCRKLTVPLPPRGYWAKKQAGSAPKKPALPRLKKGQPDRLVSFARSRPAPRPRRPELDDVAPLRLEHDVVVADNLTDPHPLVVRTLQHLTKAKPRYDGLLPWTNKPCLDINVSPTSLDRALRIADALVKGMEGAGLRVEERIVKPKGKKPPRRSIWEAQQPCDPEERVTRVLCEDEWLEFAISERVERHENPKPDPPRRRTAWDGTFYEERVPTTYTYRPTGVLSLAITNAKRLGVRATWSDGKKERLEERVGEFISRLGAVALAVRLDREEIERLRIAAEEDAKRRRIADIEAERRRWARQQHVWAEDEREKKLLRELEAWRLARDIRAYVSERAQLVIGRGDVAEMNLATRWELGWALRYARSIDPCTVLRDELRNLARKPTRHDA
ncbi:MAG: hypothetical protein R2826_01535 [Thermoleophilia bacterium]